MGSQSYVLYNQRRNGGVVTLSSRLVSPDESSSNADVKFASPAVARMRGVCHCMHWDICKTMAHLNAYNFG